MTKTSIHVTVRRTSHKKLISFCSSNSIKVQAQGRHDDLLFFRLTGDMSPLVEATQYCLRYITPEKLLKRAAARMSNSLPYYSV